MPTAGCFWSFPRLLGAPLSTTRFRVWFSITSSTLWNCPSFTVSTLGTKEEIHFTFYLQIKLNLHFICK